jgi:tRNA(Ile)-lysidine synthase
MIRVDKFLLSKKQQYYIAVSMGTDSVAALFWLKSKGYSIIPLHFNHNLRAQNGTMHEKFLELCKDLNLECKSDIGIGLNTENECRQARLNFYSRVAKGGTVITAHHLNDWVESYLLNCLRGHPNHQPISFQSDFTDFKIIHPFLLTRKEDFKQYLERNGWMKYVVEDSSNTVVKGSRRNWIRNMIIPQMQTQKLSLEKFAKKKIEKMIVKIGH